MRARRHDHREVVAAAGASVEVADVVPRHDEAGGLDVEADRAAAAGVHAGPPEVFQARWTLRSGARYRVAVIFPTPDDRLVDARGRLTFLWDVDLTREEFAARLCDPDPAVRGYWIGKLLRQAKPDDVPGFVRVPDLAADWVHFERFLGRSREMWAWLLRVGWTGE